MSYAAFFNENNFKIFDTVESLTALRNGIHKPLNWFFKTVEMQNLSNFFLLIC